MTGWRVTSCILIREDMTWDTKLDKAVMIPAREEKYLCKLVDPTNPNCTASGIVLQPKDVSGTLRPTFSIKQQPAPKPAFKLKGR